MYAFKRYCLELLDYVFEGILGDAVWGTLRTAGNFLKQSVASKTAIEVRIAASHSCSLSLVSTRICHQLLFRYLASFLSFRMFAYETRSPLESQQ